jgi:two-component system chemotaxis sensor kinase CheA
VAVDAEKLKAQLAGVFFEEAEERLDEMEAALVGIAPGASNPEDVNRIFRAIHSIKGASGSFGFRHISDFAHLAETLLDEVRAGKRSVTQPIVDALLESVDVIRIQLEALQAELPADASRVDAARQKLAALLGGEHGAAGGPQTPAPRPAATAQRYRIRFEPAPGMLRTGNDPARIFRELEGLGRLVTSAQTESVPPLESLDPTECHLSFELSLESDAEIAAVREVFAWVEGDCELSIECVPSAASEASAAASTPASAASDAPAAAATQSASAAKPSTDSARPAQEKKGSASIRVGTDKVDALINQVGELVITQSMLSEFQTDFDPQRIEKLRSGLAQLARNTRELQESVMRIRMLPISVSFDRFPRLVRDIAQKLGKEVELVVSGETTELDKTVLEQIGDPLVHLVRNSLDHGIETAEQRVAAGKPARGTLRLDAYHQGSSIVIQVSDDGRGLDAARIKAKAVERGLVPADAVLGDEQIFELIFAAGFSTADVVSDVSGRGVGMDVVRRNVAHLGGNVSVASTPGRGCVFTIHLPLTLAILDGQLIRVASETFIIPLVAIIESLQIRAELLNDIAGRLQVYRLRDEAIPVIRLAQSFGIDAEERSLSSALMVVVEGGGKKAGLVVDELLGQQQVVIKSLEANFRRVPGISGATILGDGTVAMILDVAGVIEGARQQPARRARASAATQPLGELV